MRRAVTELQTVHTLVPTQAGHLSRSTGRGTLLLIAPVQTVGLSVTTPGLRDTLGSGVTAELVGPTSWRQGSLQTTKGFCLLYSSLKETKGDHI